MGKVYDAPSVQGDVDTIDYYSDGSAIEKVVDRAHTQPWESHTLAIDQAFHETTDQYGYGSALPAFFNTHDIAALQFASWDESTAGTFVASIERAMYSGAAVAGGIEDIFAGLGPHRQFTTGAYDVDVETGTLDTNPAEFGTGLTLVNPSSAFDNSSYDNAWQLWDYQTAAQGAFEVSTFDGWGYGTWYEPVILDLDGNGVSITPRDGSLAEFDVDGDGYDEHAAWVGAGDGLLVLNDTANDLPSGVVIANRNEIAFSQTPGVTDLEAIAAYDTNHDGAIDAGDARWSDFRVWIDKNGDGYSDPDNPATTTVNENEVFTLPALGIASVSLTRDDQSFLLPDGSLIHGFSTFTRSNGTVGVTADVALAYDAIGAYAPRERLFGSPASNQVGGIFYQGEDGKSFYVVDAGRSYTNGVLDMNKANTVAVGATLTFAGGVILNWGGFSGGNLVDTITVTDTNAATAGKWLFGNAGNDSITGGIGNDIIDGGAGTETKLDGGAGDDTIYFESTEVAIVQGGSGYDTGILTSAAAITINLAARGLEALIASDGADNVTAGTAVGASIDGRGGNDTIAGGSAGDMLSGGTGNDTVNGNGGNDLIMGGVGTDTLHGNDGDDAIFGGDDADQIFGDNGNDKLTGGAGNDTLNGGAGTDTADYSSSVGAVTVTLAGTSNGSAVGGTDIGSDTLVSIENVIGGDAIDTISGDGNANRIEGGDGNDTIYAGDGTDVVIGGAGNDTLVGNADVFAQLADTLDGGAGDDSIHGEFTDTIVGGTGHDVLYAVNDFNWSIDLGASSIEYFRAGFGDDTITAATQAVGIEVFAGGGNDAITGSGFNDHLWAGAGNDVVSGGAGSDMLFGDVGADSLSGGDGDDTLYVDNTDTLIDGGAGTDIAYINAPSGMTLNLATSHIEIVVGDSGADTLDASGLILDATIYAGGGTDVITGGAGNDFLWGEDGNDTITGGSGIDVLVGGTGADTLKGGLGNDTIYTNSGGWDGAADVVRYDATGWGTDFVYDFEHGIDKINLQGSGATAGTITLTAVSGNAEIHFGSDVIVIAGGASTFTLTDIVF